MPYIGKEPVAGNFVLLDSITTSATATYALTKDSVAYSPESARNMIVSLNGVTQAPEAAFTVSGSNITFSSALTSSDVIDYILVLGDVLSVGTPSDGTVGTSQMSYPLDNFSSTGIDDNATSTAITIDSSENVGIGTTSPTARIDTRISTTTGKVAEFHNSAGYGIDLTVEGNSGVNTISSEATQALAFATNGSSNERMRITSGGNVGIGTTSPSSPLTVKGTIGFEATNSTNRWSVYTYTDNTLRFNFNGSGADEVVIDSSGNVGIGTTSPSNILHISSSDPTIRLQDTDATGYCLINAASNSRIQIKADEGNNDANTTIEFHVDGSERMRIDSSGNVGIGTTTINNPLTVNLTPNTNSKTSGSAFDGGAIRLTSASGLSGTNSEMAILAGAEDSLSAGIGFARENGGNWGTQIRFYNHSTAITTTDELTERMRIDASGNLLVGTTSTNGSTSNNTITVMGSARTLHGSVTQTGAAGWYDAFTISLPGLYIVHSYIGGYAAGPGDWSNAFFVSYTGANTAYLWNLSGSGTGNIQGRINSSTTVQLNLIGGTGIVYQYRVLRVE